MKHKSLEHLLFENRNEITDLTVIESIKLYLSAVPDPTKREIRPTQIRDMTAIISKTLSKRLAQVSEGVIALTLLYGKRAVQLIEDGTCTQGFMGNPEQKHQTLAGLNSNLGDLELHLSKTSQLMQMQHLQTAYTHYTNAIENQKKTRMPMNVAYMLAYRGEAAREMGRITHSTESINWYFKAADDFRLSAKLTEQINPKHAAYQYAFASKQYFIAAKMMTKTPGRKISALTEAIKLSEMAKKLFADKTFEACTDQHTARCAERLYGITKKQTDREMAITHYEKAIQYLPPSEEKGRQISIERLKKLKDEEQSTIIHNGQS